MAFEPSKIAVAMTKAFIAVRGGQGAASAAIREQVEKLTGHVVQALVRRQPAGGTFHIEDVQDQVELSLMRDRAHDVARAYVLYREKRAQERARSKQEQGGGAPELTMVEGGRRVHARLIANSLALQPRGAPALGCRSSSTGSTTAASRSRHLRRWRTAAGSGPCTRFVHPPVSSSSCCGSSAPTRTPPSGVAQMLYGQVIVRIVAVSSPRVAEASKLVENVFRSVNIALVNELKVTFMKMGIDIWEVIEAASTKPYGFMPFYPGPGLGGHCIPIDPFYLTWKAREFGVTTKFIELAGEINTAMPDFVVHRVTEVLNERGKPLKGPRVLILGLHPKRTSTMTGSPHRTT